MNPSCAALAIFVGLISCWIVVEYFAAKKRRKDKHDLATGRAMPVASPRRLS
jgi:hypothetical protein